MYRKELLSLLRKKPARKSQLTNFINKLNAKQIRALEHIIRLFLRGRLKVSKSHFNRLRRHRGKLRQLIYAKPKTLTYRKKILKQTGGGLLFSLIPAAISALSQLFK